MGKTGSAVAAKKNKGLGGTHLHFETRMDGKSSNPWHHFIDGNSETKSIDAVTFDTRLPGITKGTRVLTLPLPPKEKVVELFDELQKIRLSLIKKTKSS